MSRNSRSNNKRRQVSKDEFGGNPPQQPDAIPSVVTVVGSRTTQEPAPTTRENVELVSPEATMEEIPEILFVTMQKEDADEVAEALRNLYELMNEEDECEKNIKEAFRLGAPALVVLTMKKFQRHEGVQQNGCACLHNLACLTSNATTIVRTGGMEAIINALNIAPNLLTVRMHGCGALWKLFLGTEVGNVLRKARTRFVHDLDGLQVTLAAMSTGMFFDNEEMVECCCGIFWILAQVEEFHRPMKAAGVMGAVGTALDKYPDHEGVTKRGKDCLKAMIKYL